MPAPVLFIGGMDSSGGAGILRDAATALELGAACRVAVTAVTAQSDQRVTALHPVPVQIIAAQIALGAEAELGAVKIGMLGTCATVDLVARSLPPAPVVLDPVLRSSSGRALLEPEAMALLLDRLLPQVTLLTPNVPELAALADAMGVGGDAATCVQALLDRGCAAVLLKGGHAAQAALCEDWLYMAGQDRLVFSAQRFDVDLRGTGCQLASAIAVHLARGLGLVEAVDRAKAMLTQRFREASIGPYPSARKTVTPWAT
jgi:hydroxymethylpyrimidine/phosphomethylpyrimidine kinase